MIEYTLTRSGRKTLGIYIKNGSVEVRAPLKLSKSEIDRFVASKKNWIISKLSLSQMQAEKKKAFVLHYGDKLFMRGNLYPLMARDGRRAGFDGKCFYMPPGLKPEQIKDICIKMYRNLAKIHITDRVAVYAKQMGVVPAAVKINSAKTRWGSCSARKSLNFSWRLIMATDDIIDYVVVHELAHISQMNHSKRFWAVVENVLPDYGERRVRLKGLQRRLAAEDWQ